MGTKHFLSYSSKFTGNFSEEGAYIGLPTVLIVTYYVVRYWRKPYVKSLATILFIIGIFTLGPRLHIDNRGTRVVLPWAIGTRLPLIRSALPDRFTMYISLLCAVVVGLWLSIKTTTSKTIVKYAISLVAMISSAWLCLQLAEALYSYPI